MTAAGAPAAPPDYVAARRSLAHRFRTCAVLDVTGEDRVAFLQGQLTQEVEKLPVGETREAAGLTPKGKLIYVARVVKLPDRMRLLLPARLREAVLRHLAKYAIFRRVAVEDRSKEFARLGLYGPEAGRFAKTDAVLCLPGQGELAREILAPAAERSEIERSLEAAGSVEVQPESAEALRIEAGRPRFGQDMDESHLPDEVGMDSAISTTKGCYVGQEIVARLRTYGRVNKRLVGFRFPDGAIPAGSLLRSPEEPQPAKIEMGRVTSVISSPTFGPIGLGYAFREVSVGGRLVSGESPERLAIVTKLPFA